MSNIESMVKRYQEVLTKAACIKHSLNEAERHLKLLSEAMGHTRVVRDGLSPSTGSKSQDVIQITESNQLSIRPIGPYDSHDPIMVSLDLLETIRSDLLALRESEAEKQTVESCLRQAGLEGLIK